MVLDEAYIDFCSIPSLSEKVNDVPNLVVLQTLSKAWGMAGLAGPTLIAVFRESGSGYGAALYFFAGSICALGIF